MSDVGEEGGMSDVGEEEGAAWQGVMDAGVPGEGEEEDGEEESDRDDNESDDDFAATGKAATDKAATSKDATEAGVEQERKVPILFSKAQWALLPDMLSPLSTFECRADCESVSMALAESKRMRLKTVTRNDDYLRYACVGCQQFKLRFAVNNTGETIGPDGEPNVGSRQMVAF